MWQIAWAWIGLVTVLVVAGDMVLRAVQQRGWLRWSPRRGPDRAERERAKRRDALRLHQVAVERASRPGDLGPPEVVWHGNVAHPVRFLDSAHRHNPQ